MQVRSRLDVCFQRDPDPQAVARALERLVEPAVIARLPTGSSPAAPPDPGSLATDPDRSHGAVTSVVALAGLLPVPGGLFDPAIFGGERDVRFGHIELGDGIAIAGVPAARAPVPPLADRPLIPIDDPAARLPWLGPVNEAWTEVVRWAARRRAWAAQKLAAPIVDHARDALQTALGAALAATRGERGQGWPAPAPAASESRELRFVRPAPAADEPPVVRAIVFLDDQRLVLQTCRGCVIVDRDGREELRFKPVGPLASSVHGARVVFAGDQRDLASWYGDATPYSDDEPTGAPLAVYDTAHCRWLQRGALDAPRFVLDETDAAGSDVIDLATGASRALAPEELRPTSVAHTRDGRFAWLAFGERAGAGLVYELSTARPFVEPAPPPDELPAIALGPPLELASACAWHPARGWRFLHPCGALGDHARSWARLTGARAAAFSPDASALALATDDEIRVVATDEPSRVLSAFDWLT